MTSFSVLLLLALFASSFQAPDLDQRLEQWAVAVERHEAGTADEWARSVAEWTTADLLAAIQAIRHRPPSNAVLMRAAVLHADIAMLYHARASDPLFPTSARSRVTLLAMDGRRQGQGGLLTHLEFARALLDAMSPPPAGDDLVRRWYTATAARLARMQNLAEAVIHLEHARRLFPDDAAILLASGCLHETFAGSRVQSIVRAGVIAGRMLDVGAEGPNLASAERYFRRALQVDPTIAEARLRLGRVLGLQRRHGEAVAELRRAVAASADHTTIYHAHLFLGRELEMLGRIDQARSHFERASALFPLAQSPYVSLARLEYHDGNTRGARQALQALFALPAREDARWDPWWLYDGGQGRFADVLIAQLHAAVAKAPR